MRDYCSVRPWVKGLTYYILPETDEEKYKARLAKAWSCTVHLFPEPTEAIPLHINSKMIESSMKLSCINN